MHNITISTPSAANKVIHERLVDLKTMEMSIILKTTSKRKKPKLTCQTSPIALNLNQYKQLCSNINPSSSTSSLYERDYSNIEQYNERLTEDATEVAELNIENQDPDFRPTL